VMIFKMRENSVFSIMLRSAWWVSAALAVVLIAMAAAFMPTPYVPFGMLSAAPFVVIAVIVLWRNRHAPDPQRVQAALTQAAAMPWRSFAAALEKAFAAQGFAVTPLSSAQASGGVDLCLVKNAHTTLVSAKRWKAASHGPEALRELAAAKDQLAAQHAVYISLGAVTDKATNLAKEQGIELLFGDRLGALLL
jgi:restriction system protein